MSMARKLLWVLGALLLMLVVLLGRMQGLDWFSLATIKLICAIFMFVILLVLGSPSKKDRG